MNYLEEALSLIDTNKISTTEVADVLGKTGQVEGPHALTPGLFRAGEVKLIYAINNIDNYLVCTGIQCVFNHFFDHTGTTFNNLACGDLIY